MLSYKLLYWKNQGYPLKTAAPALWQFKILGIFGRVLLQKMVSTGAIQIENGGIMERYLYTSSHETIISDEMFMAVPQEKFNHAKNQENAIAMRLAF